MNEAEGFWTEKTAMGRREGGGPSHWRCSFEVAVVTLRDGNLPVMVADPVSGWQARPLPSCSC